MLKKLYQEVLKSFKNIEYLSFDFNERALFIDINDARYGQGLDKISTRLCIYLDDDYIRVEDVKNDIDLYYVYNTIFTEEKVVKLVIQYLQVYTSDFM